MALNRREWLALAGFVLICALTSALGGLATATSVDGWYQALAKPPFNPPDWVFAPVWTGIFTLLAIAGWRVWLQPRGTSRRTLLALYALQLVLNLLWSVLFFGLQMPAAALAEIGVLLATLLAMQVMLPRVDILAAALFLPYPLWVGFAAVLNAAIVILN